MICIVQVRFSAFSTDHYRSLWCCRAYDLSCVTCCSIPRLGMLLKQEFIDFSSSLGTIAK